MKNKRIKLKLKKVYEPTILILILLSLVTILWANSTINKQTENKIYNDVNLIPKNNVRLLLGTSKILKKGKSNQYFKNRISATVQLY